MIKITIEEKGKKSIIYKDVTQYFLLATDGKKEFHGYSGAYNYLIGQLHYYLEVIKEQWRRSIANNPG